MIWRAPRIRKHNLAQAIAFALSTVGRIWKYQHYDSKGSASHWGLPLLFVAYRTILGLKQLA
jgi:hypothetical protein